jgi:hypothetical protein
MMSSDSNGGWHPGLLVLTLAGVPVLWTLALWGTVFLCRGSGSGGQGSAQPVPEQNLKGCFARGKTEPEEFRRLREPVSVKE